MNVLHYSFSLSACPKCHLLICQHTSLADLDFTSSQQPQCSSTTISIQNDLDNPCQQLSSHGTNVYIFPSTTSDTHHSWTTFGTDSIQSTQTFNNLSCNHETISDGIPFANENVLHSSLLLPPTLSQIVRTQSERFTNHLQQKPPPIYLSKSVSYSTIYNRSTSFSHIKHENHLVSKSYSCSNLSFLMIIILILSFLITNTIDIVLIYIYYHTNYLYLVSVISTIILCDMIIWMNNLIQLKIAPSYVPLIPLIIRLYLLYELIELLISTVSKNQNMHIFDSTSSSSSTTTTFETNISQTIDSPIMHQSSLSYKTRKQKVFHYLTLFYLVHTGFFAFINLYFWSNNFETPSKSMINMDYFIPQWLLDDNSLATMTNTMTADSITGYWNTPDMNDEYSVRRVMSSNWTQLLFPSYIPLAIRLPSSSLFVFVSILYYLIINYSLLSTFLILKRFSLIIIPSILSRFCLIVTRIYTFIFLFHLKIWWLPITFLIVHITLTMTLLFDQFKYQHKRNTIFLQIIFSLLTQNSIDDLSIHALISLENISIFLHHLYVEVFSFDYNETTLRLILFLSILISMQIIGFIFDILSKHILYRTKSIVKIK